MATLLRPLPAQPKDISYTLLLLLQQELGRLSPDSECFTNWLLLVLIKRADLFLEHLFWSFCGVLSSGSEDHQAVKWIMDAASLHRLLTLCWEGYPSFHERWMRWYILLEWPTRSLLPEIDLLLSRVTNGDGRRVLHWENLTGATWLESPCRLQRVAEFKGFPSCITSVLRCERTKNCLQSEHLLLPLLRAGKPPS